MFLYLNDYEYGVVLDHFHYNYITRDDAALRLELKHSEQITDDIEFLVGLAEETITHLVIRAEEKTLYDVQVELVIEALTDNFDNGERHTTLSLVKKPVEGE